MLQLTCSPFLPKTQSMAVLGCYTPHHSFIVAGVAMSPPCSQRNAAYMLAACFCPAPGQCACLPGCVL